jgi:hypothetical protein
VASHSLALVIPISVKYGDAVVLAHFGETPPDIVD